MELNEIKKYLYKNDVKANLAHIVKGQLVYTVHIATGTEHIVLPMVVPIEDIGDASFYPQMEAKYLIRWLKLD